MAYITYYSVKPVNPLTGDIYYDTVNKQNYIWSGLAWELTGISAEDYRALAPTQKELIIHPTLKTAWEEYLVIRKLLGL